MCVVNSWRRNPQEVINWKLGKIVHFKVSLHSRRLCFVCSHLEEVLLACEGMISLRKVFMMKIKDRINFVDTFYDI